MHRNAHSLHRNVRLLRCFIVQERMDDYADVIKGAAIGAGIGAAIVFTGGTILLASRPAGVAMGLGAAAKTSAIIAAQSAGVSFAATTVVGSVGVAYEHACRLDATEARISKIQNKAKEDMDTKIASVEATLEQSRTKMLADLREFRRHVEEVRSGACVPPPPSTLPCIPVLATSPAPPFSPTPVPPPQGILVLATSSAPSCSDARWLRPPVPLPPHSPVTPGGCRHLDPIPATRWLRFPASRACAALLLIHRALCRVGKGTHAARRREATGASARRDKAKRFELHPVRRRDHYPLRRAVRACLRVRDLSPRVLGQAVPNVSGQRGAVATIVLSAVVSHAPSLGPASWIIVVIRPPCFRM